MGDKIVEKVKEHPFERAREAIRGYLNSAVAVDMSDQLLLEDLQRDTGAAISIPELNYVLDKMRERDSRMTSKMNAIFSEKAYAEEKSYPSVVDVLEQTLRASMRSLGTQNRISLTSEDLDVSASFCEESITVKIDAASLHGKLLLKLLKEQVTEQELKKG